MEGVFFHLVFELLHTLQTAAVWRGKLKLLSKECSFWVSLLARAYTADHTTADYTIPTYQGYQVQVLAELHKLGPSQAS